MTEVDASDLTTLGSFALRVNEVVASNPTTRKARALMAFLVMNRQVDVSRERLMELFWPDVEPDRARASLTTALSVIRRGLRMAGADVGTFLVATNAVVRWAAGTSVDAETFAEFAVRADPAADQAAHQAAQAALAIPDRTELRFLPTPSMD